MTSADVKHVIFDVDLMRNVLTAHAKRRKNHSSARNVIISAIGGEERSAQDLPVIAQQGSLVDFHKRLGHLHYDAIERLAKDPDSGINLTDQAHPSCLTCAQGKQTKNRHPHKDSGDYSPIDRIGGVVCSDLKGPMTPRDRLGNRYMINFIDYKSNYVKIFLTKTKAVAAKHLSIS